LAPRADASATSGRLAGRVVTATFALAQSGCVVFSGFARIILQYVQH